MEYQANLPKTLKKSLKSQALQGKLTTSIWPSLRHMEWCILGWAVRDSYTPAREHQPIIPQSLQKGHPQSVAHSPLWISLWIIIFILHTHMLKIWITSVPSSWMLWGMFQLWFQDVQPDPVRSNSSPFSFRSMVLLQSQHLPLLLGLSKVIEPTPKKNIATKYQDQAWQNLYLQICPAGPSFRALRISELGESGDLFQKQNYA